jgi:hypothetical protein
VDAVVVTGTLANCSTASPALTIGDAWYTSGGWNNIAYVPCAMSMHLYCFETDRDVPVTAGSASGRLAFLTVQSLMPGSGGITAADSLCGSEASLAGLPGTYLAALAQTGVSAMSRFEVGGPTWIRLDGVPIAPTALEFAAQGWQTSLNISSAGTHVDAEVFTGAATLSAPGVAAMTCNDWTDVSVNGYVGRAASSSPQAVGYNGGGACNGDPVYCLEL